MARESRERARSLGQGDDALSPNLDSTHPTTPERIKRIVELSKDLGFKPGQRPRERNTYMTMIDGLLYGDDPHEGFIRGREFLHADGRFAFSVPKGFSLQNSQDAVFAIGEEDAALRFDAISIESGSSLSDYMRSAWGGGAAIANLREVEINGRPAALAEARIGGWEYRLAVVRFSDTQLFRFLFAAQNIDAGLDRDFTYMVTSLRSLSADEAGKLEPLRVRAVKVAQGDTVRRLSARMAEREQPRAGQMVKIITE
jgi:predicted Zn-dependent protease